MDRNLPKAGGTLTGPVWRSPYGRPRIATTRFPDASSSRRPKWRSLTGGRGSQLDVAVGPLQADRDGHRLRGRPPRSVYRTPDSGEWRSSSGAAEDRNWFVVLDGDRFQRVAVALWGDRGSQRLR